MPDKDQLKPAQEPERRAAVAVAEVGTDVESIPISKVFEMIRHLSVGSVLMLLGLLAGLVSGAIRVDRAVRGSERAAVSLPGAALVGKGAGRPYVMPGVQSWIDLNMSTMQDGRLSFVADQYTSYSLLALDAIAPADNAFPENYGSDNADLELLPGPDGAEDLARRDGLSWRVPLSLNPGDHRTVVTGVRRKYRDGWQDRADRADHAGNPLRSNQEEFCYPIGSDAIGEVVIVVRSSTLAFKGPLEGTRSFVTPARPTPPPSPVVTSASLPGAGISLASARFPSPSLEDEVCLVVSW